MSNSDDATDLDAAFEKAAADVQDLSERPSNDDLLSLYAFYKQGTEGDVSGKRPGFTDFKGRAKFDAWKDLEGMKPDQAKQQYVDLVDKLRGTD
ncbi:MAG: acyl-CoA-binding protein [Myxococcota bacterium]